MVKGMGNLRTYFGNLEGAIPGVVKRRFTRWTTLKEVLKTAGGNWLQWQYGLRPLLQDVYGAVDELYRHELPTILEVRGKFKQSIGDQPLSQQYIGDAYEKAKVVGVQGAIFHCRFTDKGGFDLKRWSSLNPITLAWETLPYSFVVDWAYDIGGMLRSLETSLLYDTQFLSGYSTELWAYDAYHTQSGKIGIYQGGQGFEARECTSSYKFVRFDRVRLGSFPLPNLPTFKVKLGSERMLSAASLLAQNLSGRERLTVDQEAIARHGNMTIGRRPKSK
jgi:hypothetical protein